MSAMSDDVLVTELGRLAPEPMEADWLDVRRRARGRKRRTIGLAALAAAIVIVLVGCTAVFGPRVVSFGDAGPSPQEAVDWIALVHRANAITAPQLPDFDPRRSRRLLGGPFDGGVLAIDLTPAVGGFCVSLTYALRMSDGNQTDCVGAERRRTEPVTVVEPDGRVSRDPAITDERREQGATSLVGWTTMPEAMRAVVRFEDGTERGVERFVRVTAPIDAAFFTAEIPDELTHFPRRAVALVVLDADGDAIGRRTIGYADPDEWTFPQFGQGNHGFPPAADGARATVVRFHGTDARFVLAQAKGGVTCVSFRDRAGSSYGGRDGCLRRPEDRDSFLVDHDSFWPGPGAGPTHPVILYGLVEPAVERIELRFQDGTRTVVRPQRSTIIYEIPIRQHAPGMRLVGARLLDGKGRVMRRIVFDPSTRDLYPCDDPVDPGLVEHGLGAVLEPHAEAAQLRFEQLRSGRFRGGHGRGRSTRGKQQDADEVGGHRGIRAGCT